MRKPQTTGLPAIGYMLCVRNGNPVERNGAWRVFYRRKDAVAWYGAESMLQDGVAVKRVKVEAQPSGYFVRLDQP